ncbi:hypothetical protein AX774_g8187 [Zancudomyces culisetae]|uniref:Amino acid transporter transmembrane domain-containing protein n=1 Tax=Zancudomyces culisetae TaxID=1213189 RepID=A0A1R1PBT2_ZANCU|nr:hypothetical protein AX774_g8187 [Zancudomyces culisetae]|eukprot:OMH78426.1 hypothetical protein AX774_g8187 [Zancudomyces culisetae]
MLKYWHNHLIDLAEGRDGSQSIDLHSGVSKLGESSHPMMNNNHTSDTLVGHNKEYLDKSILDDSSYHNTEYDNINLKKLGGGVPARFSPFDDSEMNTGAYNNSNSGGAMESDSVGNSGNTIRLQKSKRLSKLKDIINDNNFDKKNDDYRELDNAGRVSEESTDFVDDQEFFFNDGQQYISPAKAPLSTYSTVLLYICVGMTSGALQLPFAFSTGGWFTIFIIFFTGIVSIISGAMVFQCVQFNQ